MPVGMNEAGLRTLPTVTMKLALLAMVLAGRNTLRVGDEYEHESDELVGDVMAQLGVADGTTLIGNPINSILDGYNCDFCRMLNV